MSLLPFVYSDPFDSYPMSYYRPRHYGFNPLREIQQLDRVMNSMLQQCASRQELGSQLDYNDKGDLSLKCHTAGFKPEELSVDVDGHQLTVSGKHVEEKEGESVERHFTRTIRLPKEMDHSKIKCELDDKGELCICVPRLEQLEAPKKNVPIEMKQSDGQEKEK